MKTKYVLSMIALAMIALLGVGMISAFGMGFNMDDEEKEEHDALGNAMKEAIENNDYALWEGLMQEKIALMEEQITEENFQELRERHTNMQEFRKAIEEARGTGDWSEVESLKEELDLKGKRKQGFGKGFKQGARVGFRQGQGSCLE